MLLTWIVTQSWGGARAHAAAGGLVGMIFGGAITGLSVQAAAAPMGMADLGPQAINELVFPVGGSLVLFASKRLTLN